MEDKATISIKRKNQYIGALSKLIVYIDGQRVGKVANGETVQYMVDAGEHTMFVKPGLDWNKSKKLLLDIKPGQVIEFDCGYRNGFFNLIAPLSVLVKTWFFPGRVGEIYFYCFLGLLVVLYTAASFKASFFVYLKEGKVSQKSGVI